MASATSSTTSSGSSSQLRRGRTPLASANPTTTSPFIPRLNRAFSETDSGMATREAHLAQEALALHQRSHPPGGRLGEVGPEDDGGKHVHRVVLDVAEPHDAREHDVEDAEQHQRLHHRPQVTEHRTAVVELELRLGQRRGDASQLADGRRRTRRGCTSSGDRCPRTRCLAGEDGAGSDLDRGGLAPPRAPLLGGR